MRKSWGWDFSLDHSLLAGNSHVMIMVLRVESGTRRTSQRVEFPGDKSLRLRLTKGRWLTREQQRIRALGGGKKTRKQSQMAAKTYLINLELGETHTLVKCCLLNFKELERKTSFGSLT